MQVTPDIAHHRDTQSCHPPCPLQLHVNQQLLPLTGCLPDVRVLVHDWAPWTEETHFQLPKTRELKKSTFNNFNLSTVSVYIGHGTDWQHEKHHSFLGVCFESSAFWSHHQKKRSFFQQLVLGHKFQSPPFKKRLYNLR